jgi:uncharacterized Zn-binding protein involved in type VI secretion
LRFFEDSDSDVGTHALTLEGPENVTASYKIIMPGAVPTSDDHILKSTTSGAVTTLRWALDLANNSQGADVNNFGDDGGGVDNEDDIRMFFDGHAQDGEFLWSEAAQHFLFKNVIRMQNTTKLEFGGTTNFIQKDTDLKIVTNNNFDIDAQNEIVLDFGAGGGYGVIFQENNAVIGSIIKAAGNDLTIKSGATSALVFTGAAVAAQGALSVAGDLTVTGNDIISSSATAITLDGADVAVAGDLTVTGGNITNAVTFDGDITLAGVDGALTFNNAGENSIKIPDNQASALIIEQADNALMTVVTTDDQEGILIGDNGVKTKPAIRFSDDAGIWHDGANIHLVGGSGEGIMINGY